MANFNNSGAREMKFDLFGRAYDAEQNRVGSAEIFTVFAMQANFFFLKDKICWSITSWNNYIIERNSGYTALMRRAAIVYEAASQEICWMSLA